MTTALILGGTQFVGKRLVKLLVEDGVNVTIATRGRMTDDFGDSVKRLVLDRTDDKTIKHALEDKEYDFVFDHTCYSPIEVREVLEALGTRIGKYIFISSVAVYNAGVNLKESDFDPRHFDIYYKSRHEYAGMEGYQEAKRAAEAVLYQQAPCPVVTVRFPYVVGEDDYTERFAFHVRAVEEGKAIGTKNPDARFGFIDSAEAAEFLKACALSDYEGPINAGTDDSISLQELLEYISRHLGKNYSFAEDSLHNQSPYDLGFDLAQTTKHASRKGFSFSSLQEVLEKQIEIHQTDVRESDDRGH